MKTNQKAIALTATIVLLLITGFYIFQTETSDVITIQSDEFSKLVEEDIFTLQVHPSYYGEINGTDLIIEDWENIENHLDELPSKDTPIAVYCRSGSMSEVVSKQLTDLGYEVVYNLEGGMNSWEQSGKELIIK